MFTSIWEDVKREFSSGNMVTRLIIINVAVFLVVNFAKSQSCFYTAISIRLSFTFFVCPLMDGMY